MEKMAYTLYFNKEELLVTPDKKGSFLSVREALDLFDPQTLHMICRGKHLLHCHSFREPILALPHLTHHDL